MTFKEAIQARIRRIRLPHWNPGAYLEPYYTGEWIGPWVTLHDPISGQPPQQICIVGYEHDDETKYEAANPEIAPNGEPQ